MMCSGKDFALIRSSAGKVFFSGKSTSLGIKQQQGSTKWAELPISKTPRITQVRRLVGEKGSSSHPYSQLSIFLEIHFDDETLAVVLMRLDNPRHEITLLFISELLTGACRIFEVRHYTDNVYNSLCPPFPPSISMST